MAYISFEQIEKYYGSQHVLKNLSLSVDKGEFVTLLVVPPDAEKVRCFAAWLVWNRFPLDAFYWMGRRLPMFLRARGTSE